MIFHPGDLWRGHLSEPISLKHVKSRKSFFFVTAFFCCQCPGNHKNSAHNTDSILPFQCSQVGISSYWLAQCIIWTEEDICFLSASLVSFFLFFCSSAFVSLAQTTPRHFLNNGVHLTSCQGNSRRVDNGRGYASRFNDSSLSPLCRKKLQ